MVTVLKTKRYLGKGKKHEKGVAESSSHFWPGAMFSYPHPNNAYISRQ